MTTQTTAPQCMSNLRHQYLTGHRILLMIMAGVGLSLSIPGPPIRADWNPSDGHKMHFPQLPDEEGWDVNATQPVVLADDWQCSQTGPITDIHFWGSWKNGVEGQIMYFVISIHADIPANPPLIPYSRPGPLLREWEITQFTAVPIDPPTLEGWYDPAAGGLVIPNDHGAYFQYNIVNLDTIGPEPFIQEAGTIYWLNISAVLMGPSTTQWGWKSSRDHFTDDAVWASGSLNWTDMYEPPRTNLFNVAIDPTGHFEGGGGTNYYGNGWYFYQDTGWWNIWFYDNPFTTAHTKMSNIPAFFVLRMDPGQPSNLIFAINWSTPAWSQLGNPPGEPRRPPIPPTDEAQYIQRQILWQGPIPQSGVYIEVPPHIISYNPEWVSIDVMGTNFMIPGGTINHECVRTSLDLAFVVTGPDLCPLPASAECAALQWRDCRSTDPTVECLPKVIRQNVPPPFFPAAGEDVLTATTGYVAIRSPSGDILPYNIRVSPNLTRVIRESPVDTGENRTVATEITEMELMADGGGGGGGTVLIRESPTRTSSGGVVGAVSANTDYPADSFFDLFVEIDIPDLGVYGLYNDAPIRLEAHGMTAMPPLGSSFKTPPEWVGVELLDADGEPTGYEIVQVRHNCPPPPDPPALAFFPDADTDVLTATTGYVVIMGPLGEMMTYYISESPPNTTQVVRESPVQEVGHKIIETEITEMELVGGGGGGGSAVQIRESPTRASHGRVVGAENTETDYPADSFFDLFVEIDIPEIGVYGLYNNDPIHLDASGITAVPPLGSSFKTPPEWLGVYLWDADGQTAYKIVEVVHELPPAADSSEWEVIECQCIDPAACHVTQQVSLDPTCVGGCPGTQVCTELITTGQNFVDYSCECVAPQPEACCFVDGHCEMLLAADCLLIDGTPQGAGTTCSLLQEACCLSDGTCMMTDPLCCDDLGGTRMGPGSQCTAPEACCFGPPNPFCIKMDPLCCVLQGGTPGGAGTSCLGDNSGNGIDDACEILDIVVCEPQGGLNPSHPSTYWYDVTPSGFGRCDFHVRVYDPNPGDYTNWGMNPYPWPAGSWAFLVHQVGTEWWASWWDTDPNCSHAFFVKTRFQFDNSNASTWGDWTTTISNTSDPYSQIVDRSANHPAEPNGSGYRVHVPTPPGASKWDQWPDVSLPGLHAADGTTLADNWECQGGLVTDLHWWGNYELDELGREKRGAGIQCINLSIHANRPYVPWCLPQDPALWGVCALFSALNEYDTGMVNSEGSKIYEYTFYMVPGWSQRTGDIYWLDIEAQSINPANPALWRWQEAGRVPVPRLCPAAQRTPPPPPFMWSSIVWQVPPPTRYSEMAFRITSGPYPPGNIVWDASDTSADRTTRSLRFKVTGAAALNAIRMTMVDLQTPVPPNAVGYEPQNFHAWDVGGRCSGAPANTVCTGTGQGTCPTGQTCIGAGCPSCTAEACPADPSSAQGGCARWVGKPGTFLESQDIPTGASYRAARLQCTPFYYDWVTETATKPITVVGAEIMPSSEYSVQTYGSSCVGIEATCLDVGIAVTMKTRRSGDVAPSYNPPATTAQPDAIDVTEVLNKFTGKVGAPVKARSQVQPNLVELNGNISGLDVVAVVAAVKGFAYPYGGPCPCPSLVTCGPGTGSLACPLGVGTCTSSGLPGLGLGAMCVKTCSGGTNAGDPCINNTHCPGGGTCDNPYCRDKCGRCKP